MSQTYYNYGDTLLDGSVAYASEVANEFQSVQSGFDGVNTEFATVRTENMRGYMTGISFDTSSSVLTVSYEDASQFSVGLSGLKGTVNGSPNAFAYYLGSM